MSEHISNPTESAYRKCKIKAMERPVVADRAQSKDPAQVLDLISPSQMLKLI